MREIKINKFTKVEKAHLVEVVKGLERKLLTEFKVEGIYFVRNPRLRPLLSLKIRDTESGWVRYVPFSDLEIRSVSPFRGRFKFIGRRGGDKGES